MSCYTTSPIEPLELKTSANEKRLALKPISFFTSVSLCFSPKRWPSSLRNIYGRWLRTYRDQAHGTISHKPSREAPYSSTLASITWVTFATWYPCSNSCLWCLSSAISFSRPRTTHLKTSKLTRSDKSMIISWGNSSASLVTLSSASEPQQIHLISALRIRTWMETRRLSVCNLIHKSFYTFSLTNWRVSLARQARNICVRMCSGREMWHRLSVKGVER